jgi:TusA-related sulfurtransferase
LVSHFCFNNKRQCSLLYYPKKINVANRKERKAMMSCDVMADKKAIALGQFFLESLAAQDFDQLEALLAPQVHFRALLPSRTCEENTAEAAIGWFRHWFGEVDTLQIVQSTADQVVDRLSLRYRLRLHDTADGWQIIEQQAYCDVQNGRIADMWLLCSGFRSDPKILTQTSQAHFNADAFYDAGEKGCTDGPLEEIAGLMRKMSSGQTLEVHAAAPSVTADLPAWCRMAGHELIEREEEHYLIRRK